jgi:hypothetical protein
MNWKELKDFCNSLPELELEKKVILWREEDAITDISAEQMEEDYYVNDEDVEAGCMPKSVCEGLIKDSSEDYPDGLKHFLKVYAKGHPILHEIF